MALHRLHAHDGRVIPTTGYLLNRLSTRTVFTAALTLFLAGTLAAALAPGFGVLLAGRVVQAVGTAMILPILMTTTLALVPLHRRGAVMGLSTVVISVAPALGPTLSGLILAASGWRALFWVMVPVVVLAFLAGLVFIRDYTEPQDITLDAASVALSAVGFGGVVYGLASLSQVLDGTAVAGPVTAFAVGLAALAAFVARQRSLERRPGARPLLSMTPFGVHNFRVSLLIVVVAMASMLGTVMLLPIYLENGLGLAAAAVGLVLVPGGLIQGVLSPFVGRHYDAVGPRPLVVPGMALMTAAMGVQFFVFPTGPAVWLVVALNLVFGVGMSMVMTPLMTLALSSLPRHVYADGSAIMNTLQQLAGAVSTALFIALLTLGSGRAAASGVAEPVSAGAAWPFALGAVLAAGARPPRATEGTRAFPLMAAGP